MPGIVLSRVELGAGYPGDYAKIVDGRSNDEIGTALGIGARTVETHLARLFARFDVASRTELATRALREGWLDLPPAER